MISALIPTRKRPTYLRQSIDSLYSLARHPDQVETLLFVDDDDATDYSSYANVSRGPRVGYKNINQYYNVLANKAVGDWLLLWNDDETMLTQDWDIILESYGNRPRVVCLSRDETKVGDLACPSWRKEITDVMGHVSLHCFNDCWITDVARGAGILVFTQEIIIHHDRLGDQVAKEVVDDGRKVEQHFHNPAMEQARQMDIEKVKELLKNY